jgi:phenylpropionate dioxygenase-like ring-hydroxylating dioxygenase large terminal subunit
MTSSFSGLVGDNRVHRTVYVSPRVLEAERERSFGGSWLYFGPESQSPSAGDYFCTEAGGRPVFMTRHGSGDVHVLHNHCPHRGALVAGGRSGRAGMLRCCYHGWAFRVDGRLQAIPCLESYEGTDVRIGDPRFDLKPLRSAVYRGFVFATLNDDAPALAAWLGQAAAVLDNMARPGCGGA